MNISTYDDLEREVNTGCGVLYLTQTELNALERRKKSGKRVRRAIEKGLSEMGLKSSPAVLPDRGPQPVLVYDPRSTTGKICDAVLYPRGDSAEVIRNARNDGANAAEKILEFARSLLPAPQPVDSRANGGYSPSRSNLPAHESGQATARANGSRTHLNIGKGPWEKKFNQHYGKLVVKDWMFDAFMYEGDRDDREAIARHRFELLESKRLKKDHYNRYCLDGKLIR